MRRMSLVCALIINVLLVSSPLIAMPTYNWSYRVGGQGGNTAYDVVIDKAGNIVIAGTFTGTMNLGGGPLTSAGSWDIFLAKFDANGVHQWSQRFGGSGLDEGKAVTVDGAGNITMTGYFRGPVGFGGAPLTGNAGKDIFVASFDGAGLHRWSHWYGSPLDDQGQDIVADASGNVIVTGHYNGATNFGGGPAPLFGGLDAFVLKLDSAGAYIWSKCVGSTSSDVGYGVAVDAFNSIYLTGTFSNTVNFGGSPLTSAGSTDVFVAKFGEDGTHQWSTRMGGSSNDGGQGIGVDAIGGVVVTGIYNGACLVKYDTNGVQQWSQTFTSSGTVQGLDLAVSPAGKIVFTGNLQGTTNFGGGPLTSAGNDDIFLTVCDAAGAHRWSRRFGNTGDDWGYACTFDNSANLIAVGIFSASVDFGGGPLISAGLSDVYVVKFDDQEEVVDTTPPVITCPAAVQVEQAGPGGTPATDAVIAAFLTGASASDDVDPSPAITNDAPDVFPLGTTTVTFRATDAAGNHAECASTVTVRDSSPPQLTVVLDKDVLWPPNHKLVTVCAEVTASDNSGAEPAISLVSITSNEPANGRGDGNTAKDIRAEIGTDDRCFDLRAERSGNGDGRVYEIIYSATDGSGNASYATAWVRVPHDMSGNTSESASRSTSLTSVHPNPFNPETTLEYFLAEDDRVQIVIYDARGSVVGSLVDQMMPQGEHRVMWNGVDQAGRPVSSGIYFVKMIAGSRVESSKIVLLK